MDDSELDDIIIIISDDDDVDDVDDVDDDDFNADVSVSTSVDDGEGILFCHCSCTKSSLELVPCSLDAVGELGALRVYIVKFLPRAPLLLKEEPNFVPI